MKEKLFISVIILNYNKRSDTVKAIQSVIAQTYKHYEIIVVDDNSSDDSVKTIHQKFPQVRLVLLKKSLGRSAHNEGFKRAKGEIIVPLDADMFLSKTLLQKMVKKLERFPHLDAIALNLKHPKGTMSWVPVYVPQKTPEGGYPCAGGFPVMRKHVFEKTGGFHPDIFVYVDEWEFLIKLWKHGYVVQYFPDLIAYHTASANPYRPIMKGYQVVKNHMQLYAWYIPMRLYPKFLKHHSREFSRVVIEGDADRFATIRGLLYGMWFFLRALPKRDVLTGEALANFLRFYFPKKGNVVVEKWGWSKKPARPLSKRNEKY